MANVFDQMHAPPPSPVPFGPAPDRVWGYAGFWWRVLAWFIDSLILGSATLFIDQALGIGRFGHVGILPGSGGNIINVSDSVDMTMNQSLAGPAFGWPDLIGLLLPIAYYALLESSRWQATLGKRLCRLRVTGLDGGRISLGRAVGRYLGKFLSAFILGIGFLMVAWTQRKQGLHDLLASTLVVRLRPPGDLVRFNPPA